MDWIPAFAGMTTKESEHGQQASLDDLSERWTRLAGLPSGPVPAESYRSPEIFKLERERIFGRSWLVMGREEELPTPHGYIVKDIEICAVQALITRDGDGRIQAFHNVCSHRNNLLVSARDGCSKLLQCPYHGWSYGSDGSLRGVPDDKCFPVFDRSTAGLTKIATRVWHGWIFINLEREPSISLEAFLGDYGPFLAAMAVEMHGVPKVPQAPLPIPLRVLRESAPV